MYFYKIFMRFPRLIYRLIVKVRASKVGGRLYVGGYSMVSKSTVLGVNVNFNGMKILGRGAVSIGDNFHSGQGCMMISEIHDYEGVSIPYDSKIIPKPINIGDNVWIGNNVLILGGITIGEGAIIQAGSVVSSNIEPLSIAGGNPARVFKKRNRNHYYAAKSERRFH